MGGKRTPILYLAPWVDLGGSDKGTIDWFKHVDRERWAPSLITTQPSPNRWLRQIEPFAEEVWELPDLMPGCSFPEFILGFIESRGVRVVHIMNSRLAFDLLPDMACLREPPAVVVQIHAEEPDRSGYVRYAARRYGNLIDAFSVTSRQLKDAVAAYDIPPSRIEVIYTGVDGEEEFNPELVEPLPLEDCGVPRILWPGRLVEQKDPMLTLEAISRARAQGTDFVLDIVGDGHMKATLEERARELGVAEAIRWYPASQEMPRWYRSADLLLMTSTFEGVPYVIYESLAMRVPVIAPALAGNVEFMDESNGVLIDPRDDADLYAEAIVRLLGDEDGRREMGQQSRQRMLAEFSLAEMGSRHDALYERLLAARPASSRWRDDELFGEGRSGATAKAARSPKPLSLPRRPLPPPTVGVLVPCFRHGIFLDGCIDSIKSQTVAPAQIVVVDDGSDDPETIEALERLERDPAVTLVRQPVNRGPSAARNRGLTELDTSYVLPLDADDRLLPDAIERMLAQIEAAPEDIGFIYPHAQHIGNRSDYVHSPAYNLWLLSRENYCPAPALFDRRVFADGGASYPKDIVVGHEDWDLILQLAERGIHGRHADGPTFLYRRQGFSRVNAVDYGPHVFQEAIEHRHPLIYDNLDRIKAGWAPALSIVLLDGERGWNAADLTDLPEQTCRDYEIVGSANLADGVRPVEPPADSTRAWLQAALEGARGRWVCVLDPDAASALREPSFVERLIYCFWAHGPIAAVVLGKAPGVTRHAFAQLDDEERLEARPIGVTFERPPETQLPALRVGRANSSLADLVLGLQATGPTQWRTSPAGEHGEGEQPNGERPGVTAEPPPNPTSTVDLNYKPPRDEPEALARRAISWQPPRLPELTPGTVRRWQNSAGWTPAETQHLCRHVGLNGEGRIITNDRNPPPGYRLEFDLGVVHIYGAPGTSRLVECEGGFELSDEQNDLGEGRRGLGYVEQAPLPMLEPLEMRRLLDGGENVLVAGGGDPLLGISEPLASLGWIEPFPILPRGNLLHTGSWGVVGLRRCVDRRAWRHRYRIEPTAGEPDSVALGSLHRYEDEENRLVALRLREDGRLDTELAKPGRASRDPRKLGGWIAAPLSWNGGRPRAVYGRAGAARIGHLARHPRSRKLKEGDGAVLGWLRREEAPGCSPLFSTTHPATGDQFVTRSAQEAVDLGYLLDGILGFILDAGADSAPEAQPETIPWGSRFGRERRYVEGWLPEG